MKINRKNGGYFPIKNIIYKQQARGLFGPTTTQSADP
jgi:hypothetical protein